MSPAGPAPERLRITTWILNSIRTRHAALQRCGDRAAPDILLLQETKVPSLPEVAATLFEQRGYHVTHTGTSGYNGVAVVSRTPLRDVEATGAFNNEHLDR